MEEVWKTVNFNYSYEVSNHGNVRKVGSDKLMKPIQMKNGAYKIHLNSSPSEYKQRTIAQLVAMHFLEDYNSKKNTKHIDKNKSNCRVDNLFQTK